MLSLATTVATPRNGRGGRRRGWSATGPTGWVQKPVGWTSEASRDEQDRHAQAQAQLLVALQVPGVAEVLAGAELGQVDEHRHHGGVAAGRAGGSGEACPSVLSSHGRHEATMLLWLSRSLPGERPSSSGMERMMRMQ